jgi:uroporphyrinogen decarboxylase
MVLCAVEGGRVRRGGSGLGGLMNSRERVLLALNHQEPDRVPIDFGGLVTSMHHQAYRNLLEYLGMPSDDVQIMDMFQQIVDPTPAIKEMFHADIVGLFPRESADFEFKLEQATDSFEDEWGVVYQRPPGGYWYDLAGHPLREGTIEELDDFRFPNPRDPARVEGLADEARLLLEKTDKALMLHAPIGGVYEQSYWLRGLEPLYRDMGGNRGYVEALAERVLEWLLEFWDLVLEEVGPYVHVVELSDDLGGQHGPLFSPDLYRKVYKPRHRRLTELIHSKTEAKVFLHCCGSIRWALPDLIEVGMDIINPVQVSAKDMETDQLKREFGRDIVFWGGGADATWVLPFGSPDDVREEVKKRIGDLAPGGGYVFGSIHNIQAEVPPENVVAMFETAYEYGGYPVGGG